MIIIFIQATPVHHSTLMDYLISVHESGLIGKACGITTTKHKYVVRATIAYFIVNLILFTA